MGGKRSAEQRRQDNERRRERYRRQVIPKTILELELKVGREGVKRALAMCERWRRACLDTGVPTEGLDHLVYRESLEMISLGLIEAPPASPREAPRSYAQLYDNPD